MIKKNMTFVFVKPDGVERGLVGEVISRFEKRKLKIKEIQVVQVYREMAVDHYVEHRDKPFFGDLVNSLVYNGPVVAMILEGPSENTWAVVRNIVGATTCPSPGTIRGDYAEIEPIRNNIVHASDSYASAQREVDIFFSELKGE